MTKNKSSKYFRKKYYRIVKKISCKVGDSVHIFTFNTDSNDMPARVIVWYDRIFSLFTILHTIFYKGNKRNNTPRDKALGPTYLAPDKHVLKVAFIEPLDILPILCPILSYSIYHPPISNIIHSLFKVD